MESKSYPDNPDRVKFSVKYLREFMYSNIVNNRWNLIFLLALLLCLSMRIPRVQHELGVDSFLTHYDALAMLEKHQPDFLQYTGVNPKSGDLYNIENIYPFDKSGLTILVLGFMSQFTGLPMEHTILLYAILMGLTGFLTAYVMAYAFTERHAFISILTGLFFSTAPIYLSTTLWEATHRTIFITLTPILLWCIIRFDVLIENKKKHAILALYFLGMLLISHRMFVLASFIPVAYIFSRIISYVIVLIKRNLFSKLFRNILNYAIPAVMLSLYLVGFFYPFISNETVFRTLRLNYRSGFMTEGIQSPRVLINMLTDYFTSEGTLPILALLGLIVFLNKTRDIGKNRRYFYISFLLMLYVPIMLLGDYTPILILPMLSLLAAYGVKGTVSFISKIDKDLSMHGFRIAPLFIISVLLGSFVFSNFMISYWLSSSYKESVKIARWMDERTYQSALFINESVNGLVSVPYIAIGNRIMPFIGFDKWGARGTGVYDYPYTDFKGLYRRDTYDFPNGPPSPILYVVEHAPFGGGVEVGGMLLKSPFLDSLPKSQDKVYDNSLEYVWMLKDEEWGEKN